MRNFYRSQMAVLAEISSKLNKSRIEIGRDWISFVLAIVAVVLSGYAIYVSKQIGDMSASATHQVDEISNLKTAIDIQTKSLNRLGTIVQQDTQLVNSTSNNISISKKILGIERLIA